MWLGLCVILKNDGSNVTALWVYFSEEMSDYLRVLLHVTLKRYFEDLGRETRVW